ncbi:hypothetical protein B0O80DRAFT_429471 [Mortierella sp. GBAus27b]|nr:hypothetical protein B0O80DRAFT_429471 [Mortierella sp. GBAus27b]
MIEKKLEATSAYYRNGHIPLPSQSVWLLESHEDRAEEIETHGSEYFSRLIILWMRRTRASGEEKEKGLCRHILDQLAVDSGSCDLWPGMWRSSGTAPLILRRSLQLPSSQILDQHDQTHLSCAILKMLHWAVTKENTTILRKLGLLNSNIFVVSSP